MNLHMNGIESITRRGRRFLALLVTYCFAILFAVITPSTFNKRIATVSMIVGTNSTTASHSPLFVHLFPFSHLGAFRRLSGNSYYLLMVGSFTLGLCRNSGLRLYASSDKLPPPTINNYLLNAAGGYHTHLMRLRR